MPLVLNDPSCRLRQKEKGEMAIPPIANRGAPLLKRWQVNGLIVALCLGCAALAQSDSELLSQIHRHARSMAKGQDQAANSLEKIGGELIFGAEPTGHGQAEQMVHRIEKVFLEPLQEAVPGNPQLSEWLGPLNRMPPVTADRSGWAAYAVLWIQSRASTPMKDHAYGSLDFYREIARRWKDKPELLVPWLNRLDSSFSMDLILVDMVPRWAEDDPVLAAKYLDMVPSPLPGSVGALARIWVKQDPRACIAWLDKMSADASQNSGNVKGRRNSNRHRDEVLEPWFEEDPKAALSWARCPIPTRTQSFNGQMALRAKMYLELLNRWLIEDHAAVITWVSGLGHPKELVGEVTLVWIETDPLAAISWAREITEKASDSDRGDLAARTLSPALVRFKVLAPADAKVFNLKHSIAGAIQDSMADEDRGYLGLEPYFQYLSEGIRATFLSRENVLALSEQQKAKEMRERVAVRGLAEKDFDSALEWLQANRAWRKTNNRRGPASIQAWPLHATEEVFSLWAKKDVQSALDKIRKVNRQEDALPAMFFLGKHWPDQTPIVPALKGLSTQRQLALLMGLSLATARDR